MPFIHWLSLIYQYTGQIISFQMMPPLRNFDDVDGRERGQKKTDDLRAMTTLGQRTLPKYHEIMYVDSLISIEPVHTHCMHARIQNILLEGVVREDLNATLNGPPSAHQRNAFEMAFCRRVNGPPLNAGLVAL